MSNPYIDIPFTLRAPPIVGLGGMYATGHGDKKAITVARLGLDEQLWVAKPAENAKDDAVIIIDKKSGLTWNLVAPGEPVILSGTTSPSIWYIRPILQSDGTVEYVHIVAKNDLLGATWYAGVDKNTNTVVIQSVPVIQNPPPAPFWAMYA